MSRLLYDLTQLLESADDADQRLLRVLELLRELVPFEQCAILETRLGDDPHVVTVPQTAANERVVLTETLLHLFGQLVDGSAGATTPAKRPEHPYLAVPLVGFDEVIGLLFVRSSLGEYSDEHLRALSVVAAKVAAYLTMLRSRGELVELARERDEARRGAEAANQAKDEFLALVSHELKTPLTSILAWAHTLREATDDEARTQASDELERNIRVQAKLIDDVLDLACIASAKLRLNLTLIEPARLIEITLEGLRVEAEKKSIRLESQLDAEAMPLVLDPDRIGQVLSTLVANAIRFTPQGGHIEIRLERRGGYARIQVSDSGGGISSDILPRVFEPFRQKAPADAGAEGGLSLRLAIAKDIVELHGGRLRAESAGPGQGATFTADLPLMERAPPTGQRANDRPLSLIRVLLVDHDQGLRESFQSVLAEYGAEITAVGSALEALEALASSRPDVLLFGDLATRESIYDLARQVTVRACPLPIASISSWRLEEKERELAAGFRLHLDKPLEIGALVDAIADLAGRGRGTTPGAGFTSSRAT